MKYRHIPTGIVVSSDAELPRAVYEPVERPERAERPERKAQPRKRQPRKKED